MSFASTSHVCLSCRRAAVLGQRHATILRRLRHARSISYTSAERQQRAAERYCGPTSSETHDGRNSRATVASSDEASASDRPVIGRYSRMPLTPGALLSQLLEPREAPKSPVLPEKPITHRTKSSSTPEVSRKSPKTPAPAELPGKPATRRSGLATTPKSPRSKSNDLETIQAHLSAQEGDRAWNFFTKMPIRPELKHGALLHEAIERTVPGLVEYGLERAFRNHTSQERSMGAKQSAPTSSNQQPQEIQVDESDMLDQAREAGDDAQQSMRPVPSRVLSDNESTSDLQAQQSNADGNVNGEQDQNADHISRTKLDQNVGDNNATIERPTAKNGSHRSDPNGPWQLLELLETHGLLTTGVVVDILSTTLRLMLKDRGLHRPSGRVGLQNMWLLDIVRIWHFALSQHLAQSSFKTSQALTSRDLHESWDWSFLPQPAEVSRARLVVPYTPKEAASIYLPSSVYAKPRLTHHIAAALLTKIMLDSPIARTGPAEEDVIFKAFEPLQEFLTQILPQISPGPVMKYVMRKLTPELRRELALLAESSNNAEDDNVEYEHSTVAVAETMDPQTEPLKGEATVAGDTYYAPTYAPMEDSGNSSENQEVDVSGKQARDFLKGMAHSDVYFDFKKRVERVEILKDPALADQLLKWALELIKNNPREQKLLDSLIFDTVAMFCRLNLFQRARETLEMMRSFGAVPSQHVWAILLRACANRQNPNPMAAQIWSDIVRSGLEPDMPLWSARIYALGRESGDAALSALEEMSQRWKDWLKVTNEEPQKYRTQPAKPSIEVANALLAALPNCKRDVQRQTTPQVLNWIQAEGLQWDIRTYNALLGYTARLGAIKDVSRLMAMLHRSGISPDEYTSGALVTALFTSRAFSGLAPTEAAQQLLSAIIDIEDNLIKSPMSTHGYTVAVREMLKAGHNDEAVNLLRARMRLQGVEMGPAIYTMLLDRILSGDSPDFAAFEKLWFDITYTGRLWDGNTDSIFCDRALEGMCRYHQILGISKILRILNQLPQRRMRPSWPALLAVAQCFQERGEHRRLWKLVENIRTQRYLMPSNAARGYGHGAFWEFILQRSGVLEKEGISDFRQMWEIDRERKSANTLEPITL